MDQEPKLPVAISWIGSKYLIFDINIVTWLRKTHHMCGVMGGTLPQAPSQNIFLGLPVQIMPEEAQLLVEKGVGYIVDDVEAHDRTLQRGTVPLQAAYMTQLRQKGEQVTLLREEEKIEMARQSQKKSKIKPKLKNNASSSTSEEPTFGEGNPEKVNEDIAVEENVDSLLLDSSTPQKSNLSTAGSVLQPHCIVPTTSNLWLPTSPTTPTTSESMALLPNVPPSYALYKHLNSKSYFMTPGLRFGCQYSVYPGDPLRYHSHFLAVGKEWIEEINLMDIVGGGRLGTGVKKGFLIGGAEPLGSDEIHNNRQTEVRVRTFSIEWAAM